MTGILAVGSKPDGNARIRGPDEIMHASIERHRTVV